MKRIVLLLLCSAFLYSACVTNSVTGRKQLSLVSDNDLQSMALVQYKDFIKTNKVVTAGSTDAAMIQRVGNRIAAAVSQYYKEKGIANPAANYAWEFNLVDSKEVNAWCMPGGKVVVYTGILPVTKTETSMAVVLGHEIVHALFGHGKERMSQQMAAEGLGSLGGVALSQDAKAVGIFNSVYGVSAQYGVILPNSRKQELESDRYGLIFAAVAGYNPREAVDFWTRMAALGGSSKPPAFMSEHPSDEERIKKISEAMPEALKYYHPK